MFRDVLRKICVKDLKHQVVGEAGDGRTAVGMVYSLDPDLVLLDLHLPELDGFGVVEAIRRVRPSVRILVLSSHCDPYTVFRAERLRLHGFVDKNTNSLDALKEAIRSVAEGKAWFSPFFQKMKAERHDDAFSFDKVLSPREREVLSLIGEAMKDDEIAERLGFTAHTAEKHRHNILRKLGIRDTTALGRYARDHGFTLSPARSAGSGPLP